MKGFALAGMIAVLLIALLALSAYHWSGSSITGFQVAEPRDYRGLSLVYSVVPLSKVNVNYSFSEYGQISAQAKKLISKCAGSTTLEDCVTSNMPGGWSFDGEDGPYVMFSVKSAYKLPQYNEQTQKVEYTELLYRFALDFTLVGYDVGPLLVS